MLRYHHFDDAEETHHQSDITRVVDLARQHTADEHVLEADVEHGEKEPAHGRRNNEADHLLHQDLRTRFRDVLAVRIFGGGGLQHPHGNRT